MAARLSSRSSYLNSFFRKKYAAIAKANNMITCDHFAMCFK